MTFDFCSRTSRQSTHLLGLFAPQLRCGPGAALIAFGAQIAIENAVVAGSKTARRTDMANIGSFKKSVYRF
jgi:hypothetical protein